ncbi:hypothetical protein [Lentibacter algarum]|uniref:hypothetical protein n=1 Tax=Lentibacter algarum TaxID=576131 RepID=UPI0024916685|nr:hypothetical protein [Lentibacter algarum]
MIISILRNLTCIFSFLLFYNVCNTSTKLEVAFKKALLCCVFFIAIQIFLPVASAVTSVWNPRGIFGFYGFQIGSLFVFSYSFGTFILLHSALTNRLTLPRILLLLLTQSKAAYLALLSLLLRAVKAKHLVLLLMSTVLVSQMFWKDILIFLPYLDFLVTTWMSGKIDPSTSYRLVQIELALGSLKLNPWIGNPQSAINIENQYFYWLSEYGIFGSSIKLVSFLLLFLDCTNNQQRFTLAVVLSILAVSFPVLEGSKVSLIVWGSLGALYRIKRAENGYA